MPEHDAFRPPLMPIDYPGAMHHVMRRADQGKPVVLDDAGRHDFLQTLGKARRAEKEGRPRDPRASRLFVRASLP